jgi:hypothetical protein
MRLACRSVFSACLATEHRSSRRPSSTTCSFYGFRRRRRVEPSEQCGHQSALGRFTHPRCGRRLVRPGSAALELAPRLNRRHKHAVPIYSTNDRVPFYMHDKHRVRMRYALRKISSFPPPSSPPSQPASQPAASQASATITQALQAVLAAPPDGTLTLVDLQLGSVDDTYVQVTVVLQEDGHASPDDYAPIISAVVSQLQTQNVAQTPLFSFVSTYEFDSTGPDSSPGSSPPSQPPSAPN